MAPSPVEDSARDRTPTPRPPAPRLWVVALIACAGQFLVVLDVSVVNVALPAMRTALGLSETGLQWVVNLYTIAFAGLMLLGGRAVDLFGRKRMFLLGLGTFIAASLVGGLAQEPWHLLGARAVQGIGAAVLAPATLTILTTSFPPGPARTRAIATWTAVGAGGGAAGGIIGGALTELLSWRWVLLINVPIGALALLAAVLWVAERRDREGAPARLDAPGALLVTLGLVTLVYGVVQTESQGWASPWSLAPLFGGIVLIGAFILVEARTAAPLVPLRLLAARPVAAANTAMFVCGAAMMSMWYFMSLYMQNVLRMSPLETGLGFLAQTVSIILGSKIAPWAMRAVDGKYVAMAGVAVSGAGFLWAGGGIPAGGGYAATVLGPGILMAFGSGLAATPLTSSATAAADPSDAGLVSGLVNTSRTVGGALGLAALSTVAAAYASPGAGPDALAGGYALAFRIGGSVLLAGAVFVLAALPRLRASEPA
ncbi:MFS transporter [Nocardiopsis suaedae]|uniref:MFS transporter n=1 Tax=Nocardiopsis suaedae TaxID=3018444 RepID=A0ABT4TFB0_9ACTN|nr:MFS transporter [Nocardiopsis suaedae]MDA2803378.1 MFS transporter [Nocardiopsis suaedae]